jgi:hypothetical protein
MTSEMLIPQVIVVGILRVLLTTCPNSARNTGGIDLHAEWVSCINFMIAHKEFFKEHEFKSAKNSMIDKILVDAFEAKPKADKDSEDEKNEAGEKSEEEEEEINYAGQPEFGYEMDRHRIIAAMIISDFFLFLLKHLKANHIVHFIYVS